MTRKTAIFLFFAVLASGCGGRQTAKRNDQNYQVVQEGQASGVTSTINGPGETPPPMTDTGADTTTNFTLPDNPAPMGTGTAPNTVAGTLPATTSSAPGVAMPRIGTPTSTQPPMTSATTRTVPTTTDTIGTQPVQQQQQPQPRRRARPPRTDTTATEQPQPPTDTTATNAPPPPTDTTKTDTTSTEKPPKTHTEKTDTTKTDTTSTEKPPV
jgi:hypothetical protein